MSDLAYVRDYKDNPALRASLNALTEEAFGFNLEKWYQHGYWDDQYVAHSFAEAGRIVANASTSRWRFHIRGSMYRAVQFGTVATLEEYRHRGLAGRLMEKAIEENADTDFMFLFAHEGVKDFYPRFGFRVVDQALFRARAATGAARAVRNLDNASSEHLQLIKALYQRRVPLSQTLGVTEGLSIFMFHCLYTLKDALFLLPDDDVLVAARIRGEQMHVFDVVSPRTIDLGDILTSATFPGVTDLVFHFRPDRPAAAPEPFEHGGEEILFVRGEFPIEHEPFKFPLTSQT